MASICQLENGLKAIQFRKVDGERGTIRIGKTSMRDAEKIKTKIEELVAAKINGTPLATDTAAWLAERPDTFYQKLVNCGLADERASMKKATGAKLEEFIDQYISKRTDASLGTKEVWRQGKLGLVEHFGADKLLADITPGDADEYKLALMDTLVRIRGKKKLGTRKLSSMTVRKRLQFAKMVFRAAKRRHLIAENPFEEVGIKATMPGMARFVTAEETQKLLDNCPNVDWRTIVALSRFGGLRCPSEVLSLKIEHIDWANNRILVTSPKTAHHPGKGTRTIPLFPELREHLLAACEAAPEGAVYVVNEHFRKSALGKQGWRNCNLRTTFEKIVERAGLERWPRLFHNLRASRQTELSEDFPSHVVCAWLGNSEDIAREHYLKVTDSHFEKASGALQKALQSGASQHRMASHGVTNKRENPEENDNPRGCRNVNADGEGFEPTVDFRPRRFSRPVP